MEAERVAALAQLGVLIMSGVTKRVPQRKPGPDPLEKPSSENGAEHSKDTDTEYCVENRARI
jgi:hypothetical protein